MNEQQRAELNCEIVELIFGWSGKQTVYHWNDRKQRANPVVTYTELPKGGRDYSNYLGACVNEAGEKLDWDDRGRTPYNYVNLEGAYLVEEKIAEMGLQYQYAQEVLDVCGANNHSEPLAQSEKYWLLLHATAENRCRAALAVVKAKEG